MDEVLTAVPPIAEPGRTGEQQRTLLVASASTLLVLITFVTPLATVGRTAAALGSGTSAVPWLLSSMPLGLAVALLPTGAFADDLGRRRIFAAGLLVVALGAVVCAVAGDSLVFIAGRLIEGAGGAAVLACALGLIGHAFPPGPARGHATGVWGASVGGGIAIGSLLTVLVDPGQHWRGTYVTVAVLAVLLAIAARGLLVESRAAQRRTPDLLGTLLLGAGLACILGALVQGRQGWLTVEVLGLFAAGAVLLALFALAETRVAEPMLDPALLRRRPFVAATVGSLANGAGATSLMAFLPTLVQRGLGRSLLVASLLILLGAGVAVVTSLNIKHLPARLNGRWLIVTALVGVAVGQILQIGLSTDSSVLRLVPGLIVVGVAFGTLNAALGREAVASVPADRTAMGSGANNTARYVGSAIGISLVAVIATSGTPGAAGLVHGWTEAALMTAGISLAGAFVISLLKPAGPTQR